MNDNAETLAPENGLQQVTPEQLAIILENHFRALAFGLLACNPHVPQSIMWECIASAMGRVLSGATVSTDIKASLDARGRLGDLVNKAIRKAYPVLISSASVASATAANGNGKDAHPWAGVLGE